MFILSCNGVLTNVYQPNEVGARALEISAENDAPVVVTQYEKYIGDGVEKYYYLNTIFPPSAMLH